jgi:hypothetical protein
MASGSEQVQEGSEETMDGDREPKPDRPNFRRQSQSGETAGREEPMQNAGHCGLGGGS